MKIFVTGSSGFIGFHLSKKLLEKGVVDMIRISDARMSGTAFGTVILHVAPESSIGGPLALIKTGDMIDWMLNNEDYIWMFPMTFYRIDGMNWCLKIQHMFEAITDYTSIVLHKRMKELTFPSSLANPLT